MLQLDLSASRRSTESVRSPDASLDAASRWSSLIYASAAAAAAAAADDGDAWRWLASD